ncbi:MAG: aspartate--tRNA ligase [Acidobacteria bacterium]|nr:aspartate--tRNA ligase [Acidobacteriota bacterium]
MRRTHRCGEVTKKDLDKNVVLNGWVKRTRDLGGMLFLDLRDISGVVQVFFDNEKTELYEAAKKLRMEDVIEVTGQVRAREEKNINPNMSTGEIEVGATGLTVLSKSEVPPFVISDAENASEELRFEYRYLDLRNEKAMNAMVLRSKAVMKVRNYFQRHNFIDIETPILNKSTPEGARDYIVPSRIHKGKFYALPQSPQIFKQILMVAGFDRYIQMARCFRDEDLRADRQPEFTQIDAEMSFIEQEDIFEIIEGLMVELWDLIDVKLSPPFPRLTWQEAMERYGTDRPDTRFGIELVDITKAAQETGLDMFKGENNVTKAIVAPGASEWSRKVIDELTEEAKKMGAKGLLWIKMEETEVKSSILKTLGEEKTRTLAVAAGAKTGDVALIVSDSFLKASKVLGHLRLVTGEKLELIDKNKFNFLWVYDFPLFEWSEEEQRYSATHHAFTSPREEDLDKLETSPESVLSQAYDLVCNGTELGGGSIRIHRPDIQKKVFKALGISEEEAEEKFGFLLKALKYGAPPHGGIAFGMDRIVAFLAWEDSIRAVIAFPKTTSAYCPLSDTPSEVGTKALDELNITLKK